MGIRYICDVCGKEYDMKGGIGPTGYPMQVGEFPSKWAVITVLAGNEHNQMGGIKPARMPRGFLVCSLACAEKALGEARDYLREGFRKVS